MIALNNIDESSFSADSDSVTESDIEDQMPALGQRKSGFKPKHAEMEVDDTLSDTATND